MYLRYQHLADDERHKKWEKALLHGTIFINSY
jgi:hypothetical protein